MDVKARLSELGSLVVEKTEIAKKFKLWCAKNVNRNAVFSIKFTTCKIIEFPLVSSFTNFPNMTELYIESSNLTHISRGDLRGFDNLRVLGLARNKIKRLPEGLFDFTPRLQHVYMDRNEIEEIDVDILDPLRFLRTFDLWGNVSINYFYTNDHPADSNLMLELFKSELKKLEIKNLKKKIVAIEAEKNSMQEKLNVQEIIISELEDKVKRLKIETANIFTVIVGGTEFQVDKCTLTTNSPVLAKMIDENHDAESLELTSISESTFKDILNFMETKNPPNDKAANLELYAASSRLEMASLKDLTANILMEKVTSDNALDIMKICKIFDHPALREKALDVFKRSFE